MAKRINVFYAYPSNPRSVGECIEGAVDALKTRREFRGQRIRFKLWPDMSVGGKSIIHSVTENIARADIFACDLTYVNFNVMFELGYAIGISKRIWVSLNRAVADATNNFQRTYSSLLGGLGYSGYTNFENLADCFERERPWSSLDQTLIGNSFRNRVPRQENPVLLYIKPAIETNPVTYATSAINSSFFKEFFVTDDPRETPSQQLEWYFSSIQKADAVLIQLLSDEEVDAARHNLRGAFVAGLAQGLKKPSLMVAPSPYIPPVDYQDLLRVHETAKDCETMINSWIDKIGSAIPERRRRRPIEPSNKRNRKLDLRSLSIGDHTAENESRYLDEYFIETSSFYRAMSSATTILIGRRGTGKTANLFGIRAALSLASAKNHVCTIKPVGYEIDGLVRVLNENMGRSERGYLIESLWKLLIFSELAYSVRAEIDSKPPYFERTAEEITFMNFMKQRDSFFSTSFSERLDEAVTRLVGIGGVPNPGEQRLRISELLHSGEIQRIVEHLGLVLANREKVAILIDNLDESWRPNHDIDSLSELLRGLLEVANDVSNMLHHGDHRHKAINSVLSIFLRSDIFSLIQPQMAEQDKLPIERLRWNNDLISRLLKERFEYASSTGTGDKPIWEKLFPEEVVGVPTFDFITRTTLPRPRDVIYLVQSAINIAVNRGSEVVTADDFLKARSGYSDFVFKSVLAEDDPRKGRLEAVLFEFAGSPRTLQSDDIDLRLSRAGVDSSDREFYINLLCDINFLGIRVSNGSYRYPENEDERRNLREVAKRIKFSEQGNYEINVAFHQVLQID